MRQRESYQVTRYQRQADGSRCYTLVGRLGTLELELGADGMVRRAECPLRERRWLLAAIVDYDRRGS